jgi:hypothetical protein
MSGSESAARKASFPIRPKPLMPTRVFMENGLLMDSFLLFIGGGKI